MVQAVPFLFATLPSISAFRAVPFLSFKKSSIQKTGGAQLLQQKKGNNNYEDISRVFRHSLSPLDEKVAIIREHCNPLEGMAIQHVGADECILRLRCANATHQAIFSFGWWKLDEIRFIETKVEDLSNVDESAHLGEEQETQRFLASKLNEFEGVDPKELSPIDRDMVKNGNYQRTVAPAVGAKVQGAYLGGGRLVSFGDPPTASVDGWAGLFFDLGQDGWLCCYNALDENGYSLDSTKHENTELLRCTGEAPVSVISVDEKIERLRDAIIPLLGKTIEYFETMEIFHQEACQWHDDERMPIRIFCSNQTVLSFSWGKADNIQVAECESPAMKVSVGELTLAEAVPLPEEGGSTNDSSPESLKWRWKRNGIPSILGAVGRTVQGAGATSNSLRLEFDDNVWLEIYNDLDKNRYSLYQEKPSVPSDEE